MRSSGLDPPWGCCRTSPGSSARLLGGLLVCGLLRVLYGSTSVGLFGNKGEKAARRAAAEAEVARLGALAPVQLAAEVMSAFAAGSSAGLNELQVGMALVAPVGGSSSDVAALRAPVRAAVHALEVGGLLERIQARGGGWMKMTPAGEAAGTAGTVAEALASG